MNVNIMRCTSMEALNSFGDDSLDFVYIDGCHQYEFVYEDIDGWFRKIHGDGIIGGHDIFNYDDVAQAVSDWSVLNGKRVKFYAPDWLIMKGVKI